MRVSSDLEEKFVNSNCSENIFQLALKLCILTRLVHVLVEVICTVSVSIVYLSFYILLLPAVQIHLIERTHSWSRYRV